MYESTMLVYSMFLGAMFLGIPLGMLAIHVDSNFNQKKDSND